MGNPLIGDELIVRISSWMRTGTGPARRTLRCERPILLLVHVGRPEVGVSELAGFFDAGLHDGDEFFAVLEERDVFQDIAIDDEEIGEFSGFDGADFPFAAEDFGSGSGGAGDDLEGIEADVFDEEFEFAGIVAVGIPTEAVVAPHAESSADFENLSSAFGSGFEGFLVAIDDALGESEFGTAFDAGEFEIEGGDDGGVADHEEIEGFIVHEGAVFEGVVSGAEGVFDPFISAAVSSDLEAVVVGGLDDGVHFIEGHAEGVVIVGIGSGGVSGGVGFDPFDAILDEFADCGTGFVGSVDEEDESFHADLAEVGIPVHESSDAADFASAGGEAWAGKEIAFDAFFEPDVDVEETAPAARGGIAAFEGESGVAGGEESDVFDGVLDVEVFESGDVEVGGVEVGFDEAGEDRAAAGIDGFDGGGELREAGSRTGITDETFFDQNGGIGDGGVAGTADEGAVLDESLSGGASHVSAFEFAIGRGRCVRVEGFDEAPGVIENPFGDRPVHQVRDA